MKPIEERSWYQALAVFAIKEVHTIWHERFGHLREENLIKMKNMAEDLDLREPPRLYTCLVCLEGQMTKKPHKAHIRPGQYPNELIHIDTIGPLKRAKNRAFYFIYFHYDKTKEAEYYTMKTKDEVLNKFKLF